jgi:TonB family protein
VAPQTPPKCARSGGAVIAQYAQAVAAAPESFAAQLDLARCFDSAWRWNDVEPAIVRALQIADTATPPASFVPAPPADGRFLGGVHVPTPSLTKDVSPEYPYKAYATGLSGMVIAELVIDPKGNVREATAVRSIPGFDEPALRAAKRWKYSPTMVNGAAVEVVTYAAFKFGAPAEYVPADWLDLAQLHHEQGRHSLARAALLTALTKAREDRERFAGFREPLGQRGTSGPPVTPPRKIKHVNPKYPPEALQMREEGRVIIEGLIDIRGHVGRTRVVTKPSMLDAAASLAVGQWVFEPALRDSRPFALDFTTTVTFRVR